MGYDVDEERLKYAMEDKRKEHELFDEALRVGWKPDFQKAIENWHTVCLELEIGEGLVEHILEEHPEDDIIERLELVLEGQAEEFLAEQEEERLPQKIADAKVQVSKLLEGFEPPVRIQILRKLLNTTQE